MTTRAMNHFFRNTRELLLGRIEVRPYVWLASLVGCAWAELRFGLSIHLAFHQSGADQRDHRVDGHERPEDRRRLALVEHAQADGRYNQVPDNEQVEPPEHTRHVVGIVEKLHEDAEVRGARERFPEVVQRHDEECLHQADRAGVRVDRQHLLVTRVAAEQRVEHTEQEARDDEADDRHENQRGAEREILAHRGAPLDTVDLLLSEVAGPSLGLTHLLVDHRVLSHLRAEERVLCKGDEQGDDGHGGEPAWTRDDPREGLARRREHAKQPREHVAGTGTGLGGGRRCGDLVSHDGPSVVVRSKLSECRWCWSEDGSGTKRTDCIYAAHAEVVSRKRTLVMLSL